MNKNKMSYSLTNKDIEKFLGPNHIIKYSELSKYDDIDDSLVDGGRLVGNDVAGWKRIGAGVHETPGKRGGVAARGRC